MWKAGYVGTERQTQKGIPKGRGEREEIAERLQEEGAIECLIGRNTLYSWFPLWTLLCMLFICELLHWRQILGGSWKSKVWLSFIQLSLKHLVGYESDDVWTWMCDLWVVSEKAGWDWEWCSPLAHWNPVPWVFPIPLRPSFLPLFSFINVTSQYPNTSLQLVYLLFVQQ